MKKTLFVVLDKASATGMCVMNAAACLSKAGYAVDVLCCGKKAADTITEDKVRLMHIAPHAAEAVSAFAAERRLRWLQKGAAWFYKMQVAAGSLLLWPWCTPFLTYRLYRRVKSLYKTNQYDIVIPAYVRIDALLAGHWLKKRYPQLTYIPYFLDSLSGGAVPKLLSKKQKIKKGLWWEKHLLANADRIVVMKSSEEHHRLYSSGRPYYAKMKVLDIPMLVRPAQNGGFSENEGLQRREEGGSEKKQLTLTYLGSMPLAVRKPYYGLGLLRQLDNVTINMVGDIPDSEPYRKFCAADDKIRLLGRVPHEEVARYIEEADVLLNFGNTISEMVPSKIFEYMAWGKPILSFSPTPADPGIPYLTGYPGACLIDEQSADEHNLQKLQDFLGKLPNSRIPFEAVQKQYYVNTPECFRDFIVSIGTEE